MWQAPKGQEKAKEPAEDEYSMNLSDPEDVHYLYENAFGEWPDELEKIHKKLKQLRYGGAMDEGEDLRTNLICVTNTLLDLIGYMRTHEWTSMNPAEKK